MNFGDRLKRIRKENGYSQKELGDLLQLGQTTIANYEKNLRFPNHEILLQLSNLFNISIDYLIGRKEEHQYEPFENSEIQNMKEDLEKYLYDEDEMSAVKYLTEINIHTEERMIQMYEEVFRPILVKVGILWQNGEISVAKEHYISAIIHKLIIKTSINMLNTSSQFTHDHSKVKPIALCMSLSSEAHIIGIRMISDYFTLLGYEAYFIGNNVPTESLIDTIINKRPKVIAISVTLEIQVDALKNLIHIINSNLQKASIKKYHPVIVVGGQAIQSTEHAQSIGATIYAKDYQSLKHALQALNQEEK